MLQLVPHVFVGRPETDAVGLGDQSLFGDELVCGAGGEKGQQLRSHSIAARKLLTQHVLGHPHDILAGHVLTVYRGHNARGGSTAQHRTASGRDQVNQHRGADQQKQPSEHNFLNRARGLQKSNHVLVTPEIREERMIINYCCGRE